VYSGTGEIPVFEIVIIIVLVTSTIGIAALIVVPRMMTQHVIYATEPDRPKPFGYRMSWLAIQTSDAESVIEALGLIKSFPANWNNGIGAVYSEETRDATVFVSPPVNGWTFVVGLALPQPIGEAFVDKTLPLLRKLGSEFKEVHYYLAYPDLDAFAWARVAGGKLLRAYAVNDVGVVWNKGRPGKEEKRLGNKLCEIRGIQKKPNDAAGELVLYPTEQHIMKLAAKWSLDPTELANIRSTPALGSIGHAPAAWRSERLRRAT